MLIQFILGLEFLKKNFCYLVNNVFDFDIFVVLFFVEEMILRREVCDGFANVECQGCILSLEGFIELEFQRLKF